MLSNLTAHETKNNWSNNSNKIPKTIEDQIKESSPNIATCDYEEYAIDEYIEDNIFKVISIVKDV
ncbi:MAG TPA: hypothetical protein VD815_05635 [Candidatus Saccharimonadales bacterium]|nr:hypothetical protein [Candidatus Saccharimonadales bacterium]